MSRRFMIIFHFFFLLWAGPCSVWLSLFMSFFCPSCNLSWPCPNFLNDPTLLILLNFLADHIFLVFLNFLDDLIFLILLNFLDDLNFLVGVEFYQSFSLVHCSRGFKKVQLDVLPLPEWDRRGVYVGDQDDLGLEPFVLKCISFIFFFGSSDRSIFIFFLKMGIYS